MIMRKIFATTLIFLLASPVYAQKVPPYWGSIDEPEARMRTGPSTEYPTMWLYKRERMPIKILAKYKAWRKVEDVDKKLLIECFNNLETQIENLDNFAIVKEMKCIVPEFLSKNSKYEILDKNSQ